MAAKQIDRPEQELVFDLRQGTSRCLDEIRHPTQHAINQAKGEFRVDMDRELTCTTAAIDGGL